MTLAVAPVHRAPRPATTAPAPRPPAKRVVAPFTLRHFRGWARDLILDTGQSWHIEDFQEAFIEDVFADIPECWLIVPEGNGKTTLAAGLGLYHAEFKPFASVPVAASSREQAEIMYRQMEGFVLRSPRMYEAVHSAMQAAKGKRKTEVPRFTCLEGYRRINHYGGGRIQVFAADDRTGDGIIPTFGLIDEMHRHRDLALYRTWAGKLAKRQGQIVGISTRGEPGSDFEETLRRIRETSADVVQTGSFTRAASERVVMHEWAVPDGEDTDSAPVVKAANPFSGVSIEMLAAKRDSPTMTANHWLRFVCNRPTRGDDGWLGPNGVTIWEGLTDPFTMREGGLSWVGIDVALKHDTTAVVVMQRRDEGEGSRFHATCRLFVPTDDAPVDVTDVMQHVRELAATYDVEAISFDPRFFDVPAKMLLDEGLPVVEVPQSIDRMTAACGSLYEAIMSGQITHDDDRQFTAQVLNAVPRFSDRGFTLAKGKSRGKIDAAIALALAYDRAQRGEVVEEFVGGVAFA